MDRQNIEPQYIELYRRHWSTVRNSVKRGVFKDVYHFVIYNYTTTQIGEFLKEVKRDMGNIRFKINAAFGFILQNRSTDELKFFHPWPSNNNKIWEIPQLIENTEDFAKLRDDLEREDAFEFARLQRPDTSWKVPDENQEHPTILMI